MLWTPELGPFIKVQKLKQKSTRAAKVGGILLVLSVLVITGLVLAGGYEVIWFR
jgi:hypothetical protein